MISRALRLFFPLLFACSFASSALAQADLRLTDLAVGGPAAPGAYLEVVADYANYGPSPATDFKLTISVPPGTLYDGYGADDERLTCAEPPKGGTGNLVCSVSNVATGSFNLGLTVRVDPAAVPGTVVTFSATLTSSNAITPTQTKSGSLTVIEPADLHAEMSAPASATAGDTFLTTMTVTNRGPGSAVETTVMYSQQGGGSYGPMTGPAGWSCSPDGASCTIDSFPPGTTATFTIKTKIPTLLGSGTLSGKLIAFTPSDGNQSDNIVRVSTEVIPIPRATLKVTLTTSPAAVYRGNPLTYTAQITNTSNVDAQNVQLSWTLPPSETAVGTIAAGTTHTVTSTIGVTAEPGTVLTAWAMVSATNVIYDSQSDYASVSTTVAGTRQVDLMPAISAPLRIRAGETGEWTYSIHNSGPDTVSDWQLTVPLPPNTTLASYYGIFPPGSCSGLTLNVANTQVTCHGTSLPFEFTLDLVVPPGTTTPIHATATASTANADTNPANDTATADTAIYTQADLLISIATDKNAAVSGERVIQTFAIANKGPDAAAGVALDVTLPGSVVTVSSTFASCSGTAPVHCVAPSLAAGGTLYATVSFQAPGSAGWFRSDAYALAENAGGTTEYIPLQVTAAPSLSDVMVAVDAAPLVVQSGDVVTYTLAATNVGISAANNVTVQFDLPPALTFVSASPQCSGTSSIICTAGTLTSGSWATFTVTARAVAVGTITATATVSTTSPEANNANNSESATIVVNIAPPPPTPSRRRAARH